MQIHAASTAMAPLAPPWLRCLHSAEAPCNSVCTKVHGSFTWLSYQLKTSMHVADKIQLSLWFNIILCQTFQSLLREKCGLWPGGSTKNFCAPKSWTWMTVHVYICIYIMVLYLMTHNAISAIWAPGLSPGTSHPPLPAAKNLQRSPTPRH